MPEKTTLIIGAGMAGLAAADALSAEGLPVVVLEARDRVGGRVWTTSGKRGSVPIELGAEFIHGAKNETWRLIRTAGLATHEVPDKHWRGVEGALALNSEFWEQLGEVFGKID